MLRDHVARGTALGQAVKAYLDRGELVPDQIVLDMVREAMHVRANERLPLDLTSLGEAFGATGSPASTSE